MGYDYTSGAKAAAASGGGIGGAKEDRPAVRAGPSTLAPAIASGLAYCISNTKGSLVGLPLE